MSKPFIITITILSIVTGLIIGGMKATLGHADSFNTNPIIIQTVKHQGEVLDNHEARITNTENDVKDLQAKTETAPSVQRVEVPVIPASVVVPEAPKPVVIVSASLSVGDPWNGYCYVKYSDSTTNYVKTDSGDCSKLIDATKV